MTASHPTRRRFLTVVAATGAIGAIPAYARDWTQDTWQGRALGADTRITLSGPVAAVKSALREAVDTLRWVERQYSLFDPESALSRLNAEGRLPQPDPHMLALLGECDDVHRLSRGAFDPTVQPLWVALAASAGPEAVAAARARIGWTTVRFGANAIELGPGQALTLNGIAQGAAADLVVAALGRYGIDQALVNTGEFSALGGPWNIGIADPRHGVIATRRLTAGAIATSSPGALSLGDDWHILSPHPEKRPRWSSVSVEADRAVLADALSTAAVLMPAQDLADLVQHEPTVRRIVAVDEDGDVATFART